MVDALIGAVGARTGAEDVELVAGLDVVARAEVQGSATAAPVELHDLPVDGTCLVLLGLDLEVELGLDGLLEPEGLFEGLAFGIPLGRLDAGLIFLDDAVIPGLGGFLVHLGEFLGGLGLLVGDLLVGGIEGGLALGDLIRARRQGLVEPDELCDQIADLGVLEGIGDDPGLPGLVDGLLEELGLGGFVDLLGIHPDALDLLVALGELGPDELLEGLRIGLDGGTRERGLDLIETAVADGGIEVVAGLGGAGQFLVGLGDLRGGLRDPGVEVVDVRIEDVSGNAGGEDDDDEEDEFGGGDPPAARRDVGHSCSP